MQVNACLFFWGKASPLSSVSSCPTTCQSKIALAVLSFHKQKANKNQRQLLNPVFSPLAEPFFLIPTRTRSCSPQTRLLSLSLDFCANKTDSFLFRPSRPHALSTYQRPVAFRSLQNGVARLQARLKCSRRREAAWAAEEFTAMLSYCSRARDGRQNWGKEWELELELEVEGCEDGGVRVGFICGKYGSRPTLTVL